VVADQLQQRLVKTGGRLVKHARYYWLLLAESHLTRHVFESMVPRIELLPLPAGIGQTADWSLQGVKTRRLCGPWRHGATLTARQLQSVPVRRMLRTVAGVENGNPG